MDIGIGLPTTVPGVSGADLVEFARRADRRGFRTLAALDRFVYDNYDSITALAAAAAATSRIRLAATVLLAAYRPSVAEVAKQLSTVDRLSGGRLVVGVAAGGRPDDFEACGADYRTRGRRLDEMLERLPRIWAGEEGGGPRPERGEIPFWVGGHSDAALRRAAKHGQAWIAPGGSVAGYPDLVARAEKVFAEEGRVDRPRMVSLAYFALGEDHRARGVEYLKHYYTHVGPKAEFLARGILSDAGRVRETVAGYAEAGCDELILFPGTGDPDQVDRLAEIVLP
ncbi:MAG TPA: LLM class flavin-dependent oxidoreductase [Amycolatopsis sp.]|nr:LLM class flavin-dependent oxidoreductase [Amycolatopsis sp.]